jgi:exosortase
VPENIEKSKGASGKTPTLFTIAVIILLLILYLPVLPGLVNQWLNDPNYRHGLIIPPVSAILLWRRLDKLKTARPGGGKLTGLALIAIAMALLIGGTAASELFTARLSIPVLLLGMSFFIFGRELAYRAAAPLSLLFLMIPLPYIIYYKITFPFQLFNARLSAGLLHVLSISVIRRGNILHLSNYSLEVITACSGLRSMITMIALALIMVMISDISRIRKVVLVFLSVPIAIAANTFRLTAIALGAYAVSPAFADGVLHQISGLMVFTTGFVMLLIAWGILKWSG